MRKVIHICALLANNSSPPQFIQSLYERCFVGLYRLHYGDEVYIHAWGQAYTFSVRENARIAPNDWSILRHEEYSWLTLLTCQGYDTASDSYRYRRAVRAVRQPRRALRYMYCRC